MDYCIRCDLAIQDSAISCILCQKWIHSSCSDFSGGDDIFICSKCDGSLNISIQNNQKKANLLYKENQVFKVCQKGGQSDEISVCRNPEEGSKQIIVSENIEMLHEEVIVNENSGQHCEPIITCENSEESVIIEPFHLENGTSDHDAVKHIDEDVVVESKSRPKKAKQRDILSEVENNSNKKPQREESQTQKKKKKIAPKSETKKKTLAQQSQLGDALFSLHIKSETSDELNCTVYSCQTCSKFPSTIHELKAKKHALRHENMINSIGKTKQNKSKTGKGWACSACDFKSVKKTEMNKHYKQNHGEEKSEICPTCGSSFANYKTLRCHMQLVHLGIKKMSCDQCDYKCKDNYDLKKHVQRKHKIPKQREPSNLPNVSDKSSFPISSNVNVTDQINVPDEVNINEKIEESINKEKAPNFTCSYCDKIFPSKTKLTRHEKGHTGDNLPTCEMCNKSFRDNYNLKKHLKQHDKIVTKYACNFCTKTFAKENTLLNHIKRNHAKYVKNISSDVNNEFNKVDNRNKVNNDAIDDKIVSGSNDKSDDNVTTLNNNDLDDDIIMLNNNDFLDNEKFSNLSTLSVDETIFLYLDSDEYGNSVPFDIETQTNNCTMQNEGDSCASNEIICDICDSVLATKFSLQRHITEMHSEQFVKCNKCNGIFSDKMSYTAHRPCKWTCLTCEKTFVKYSFYITHTNSGICA